MIRIDTIYSKKERNKVDTNLKTNPEYPGRRQNVINFKYLKK